MGGCLLIITFFSFFFFCIFLDYLEWVLVFHSTFWTLLHSIFEHDFCKLTKVASDNWEFMRFLETHIDFFLVFKDGWVSFPNWFSFLCFFSLFMNLSLFKAGSRLFLDVVIIQQVALLGKQSYLDFPIDPSHFIARGVK